MTKTNYYKKPMSVVRYDENGLKYLEMLPLEVTPERNIVDYSEAQDMRPNNDREKWEQRQMQQAMNKRSDVARAIYNMGDTAMSLVNPLYGTISGAVHTGLAAKDVKDNGLNWSNGIALGMGLAPVAFHGMPRVYNGAKYMGKKGVQKYYISTKDVIRRMILSNRLLGIYTPYKVGLRWEWDANGKIFGKRIGEGSEMDVFEHLLNPDKVLKIESTGYESLNAMRKGILHYLKRNLIPYQERSRFIGYMRGVDAATRTKERFYPVFRQGRLRLETNTTPMYWDRVLVPKIDEMLRRVGYRGSAKTSFTNGKYTISDMSPYNIGYNKNGELRFLDFYVE